MKIDPPPPEKKIPLHSETIVIGLLSMKDFAWIVKERGSTSVARALPFRNQ